MEKTTVEIKKDLHNEIREFCDLNGVRINKFVDTVLRNDLSNRKQLIKNIRRMVK